MNRLTPEIVSDAFARTGMEPVQMAYCRPASDDQPAGCCGLYAVALRDQPSMRWGDNLPAAAGVSRDYARGFMWGWDCDARDSSRAWSDETRQGFEDGRAAWLAVGEGKEARNG